MQLDSRDGLAVGKRVFFNQLEVAATNTNSKFSIFIVKNCTQVKFFERGII